jgi:hypothetical protein
MVTWSALVWNMSLGSPAPRSGQPRTGAENWKILSELMKERSVDVALLNEATTAVLKKARTDSLRDVSPDPVAYSHR